MIPQASLVCLGVSASHPEHSKSGILARTAIDKYHRPGGLNNRHLFLTVLEAGKFKVKVLADLVLGEGSLPASQMAIISLCAHLTSSLCMQRERDRQAD